MSQMVESTLALLGGTPVRSAPLTDWPIFDDEEVRRVTEVAASGKWWWGENVRQFEQDFAALHTAKHGISCSNGTIGLIIALRTCGVGTGDEVIVPAYSFIASATAVTAIGAVPRFADVELSTGNIDFDSAEKLVTEHTRAVMLVHFAGLPVDMNRARDFAKRHNLRIIEDACHSWGTLWNGKGTGALGDIGSFSFQFSKNITSAEGGIMLTDDDDLAAVAKSYTHVGRLEGKPWYEHYLLAGNNRMTEFQAAILLAQMTRMDDHLSRRERAGQLLDRELAEISGIAVVPRPPEVTRRAWHMYLFRYSAAEFGGLPREKFLEALNAEGVPCSVGYLHPVYRNPAFRDLVTNPRPEDRFLANLCRERGIDYANVTCPAAERLCGKEIVWLPHRLLLEDESEMSRVVDALRKVQREQHALMK